MFASPVPCILNFVNLRLLQAVLRRRTRPVQSIVCSKKLAARRLLGMPGGISIGCHDNHEQDITCVTDLTQTVRTKKFLQNMK